MSRVTGRLNLHSRIPYLSFQLVRTDAFFRLYYMISGATFSLQGQGYM